MTHRFLVTVVHEGVELRLLALHGGLDYVSRFMPQVAATMARALADAAKVAAEIRSAKKKKDKQKITHGDVSGLEGNGT